MYIKTFKIFENSVVNSDSGITNQTQKEVSNTDLKTAIFKPKDVVIKVEHPDNDILNLLISNLAVIISKRKLRNVRVLKIEGDLKRLDISILEFSYLIITMSNNDKICAEYKQDTDHTKSITIKINDELFYDLDHDSFNLNVFINKIPEQYFKFLSKNNWKIKN